VARRPAADLRSGLDRLAEAGLLFCRGVAPQSSYLFKHALVQDAAYGTLLRARRQELHARVAAELEQHFADLVERQPELQAHHLTAAGDTEHAVDQWLKAGRRAADRSAHLEAIGHFERGLSAMTTLSKGPTWDGREIELQLARGLSLFATKGFISAEAADAFTREPGVRRAPRRDGRQRARELAEGRGDARQLFMALCGLWQSAIGSSMIPDCLRLSDRLLHLTAGNADDGLRLQAHHSAWTTYIQTGELVAAREHCEAGRRLYDPERHRSHRLLYGGHDPGVCACSNSAAAHWQLGYPEQGLAIGSEAVSLAQRIGHPFSLELALVSDAMLHLRRGEPELALQRIGAAEELVAEQRLAFVQEPRFFRGAALAAQGAFAEAVACLREGLSSRLGAARSRSHGCVCLADALARQGDHGAALAAVKDGLEAQEQTGLRAWASELHRLEGIALFGLNRLEEAEIAFHEALRVARNQQAKSYELRAATNLARLWGEQGRRTEARELLAPVYGWFTEGFNTADLKEAKGLLDKLT
jgi:predicted ATPase